MVELRINKKTNQTSWGFSDGVMFYPFGSTEIAKAMATLLEMKYKSSGDTEGNRGEPQEEWSKTDRIE